MAPATLVRPDQAPMARERSSSRKEASRIARLPGMRSAPPMPWSARAAMSASSVQASEQSTEATPNQRTPMMYTRRRPYRSPSDPPSSMSAASVRVYAFTTHWSASIDAPKSLPIDGSAMPTTLASRNVTPDPRTVAAITQRPCALRYWSSFWEKSAKIEIVARRLAVGLASLLPHRARARSRRPGARRASRAPSASRSRCPRGTGRAHRGVGGLELHCLDDLRRTVAESLPVRRIGTIDDIGHAAVFLMTNPYVTGAVLEVSGGEPLVTLNL